MKNGGGFRLFKIFVRLDGELWCEVHLERAGEMVGGGEGEVDFFAAQYFRDVSAGDRCAPTPCTLFIKCVQHSISSTNHAVINSDASSTPTLCTLFIKCVQPFSITTTIYTTTYDYTSAALPRTLFIKCVQHSISSTNDTAINSNDSFAPTLCTLFIKCVTTFRPHIPCTLFIKCVQRGAAELRGAGLVRGSSHAAGR